MKRSAPKDDPWTTPLADPGVATSNGRHSATSQADAAKAESEILDALDDTSTPSPLDPVGDSNLAGTDVNGTEVNGTDVSGTKVDDEGDAGAGGTHKDSKPKDSADKKPPE
jgi:hypothetical protein